MTVGPGELLDVQEVLADRPVWTVGNPPAAGFDCTAQVRAHGGVSPASARIDGDRLAVRLHSPQRGVAPGQAIVLYDGDAVLGSATINIARAAA